MANGERTARLQQQLDAAQRITHVGSWEWVAATNAVVWSDELYRIVGLPVGSEVDISSHEEHVHVGDRERLRAVVDTALAMGGQFSLRLRMVRRDGSQREVDMIGEPTFDASGALTGLIGTSRDITEELRREQTIRLFTDIVEGLAIGLSVWRVDQRGAIHLVGSNSANERLTGLTLEHVGMTMEECFPAAMGTSLPNVLRSVDQDHPRREVGACRIVGLPDAPTFAIKAFSLPDRCIGLALEDVTQRTRDQRLHFAESRALQMLAAEEPLDDVLATIVSVIEELVPDTMASALLLDATGTRLVRGASPSLPEGYTRKLSEVPVGPKAGSSGTAAYRRDAVFVADIETDPLWEDYRTWARPYGLRACWSTPILTNDGRVLGTFAMYYRTPRMPSAADVEMITRAVHVAGIVIERRRLDERLAAFTAPLPSNPSPRSERS